MTINGEKEIEKAISLGILNNDDQYLKQNELHYATISHLKYGLKVPLPQL